MKQKSWMNRHIFFEWLRRFDAYMAATPGCYVAMLIFNSSAHGLIETLPVLLHLHVISLPKSIASRLQPFDGGLISIIKNRYRIFQVKYAVALIDSGVRENLCDIDMKTAIENFYGIWNETESRVVQKCWDKTGLASENDSEVESEDVTIH